MRSELSFLLTFASLCRVITIKYLLISTQRSGSTFLCGLLNLSQVVCGMKDEAREQNTTYRSEMMFKYSRLLIGTARHAQITWHDWHTSMDKAFQLVEQSEPDKSIIGFKLLYDQVPMHLRQHFFRYLETYNIFVIHLVREATVLSIASATQLVNGIWTTSNKELAKDVTRQTKLVSFSDEVWVNLVKETENIHHYWTTNLENSVKHKYVFVSYEKLITTDRNISITELLSFLSPGYNLLASDVEFLKIDPIERLHESTCSSRVANYSHIHDLLYNTSTIKACDYLEKNTKSLSPSDNDFIRDRRQANKLR